MTAEWLESSPPNIEVGGSNPHGLKCDNQKGYVGSIELLPSMTAEWLESSPPNIWVDNWNPHGLKCDNRKSYVGGWIYPEYSVAWLITVVGFDS